MQKKRILFVNEFSKLSTGFSVYGYEVMSRLYATGKYELAEQASYIGPEEPRILDVPWEVYPVIPSQNDQKGLHLYNTIKTAQFGEVKLNEHLLAFRPDIVISIRDNWMDAHIANNPLRPNFKWIYMPTVDGELQRKDWLHTYRNADYITTYSEWAKNILELEGIRVTAVTSPCSDHEIFKPSYDKRKAKEELGLNPDWFIIQTVMRNQPRKLYPDLLKSFAMFLQRCHEQQNYDLASKTFLHLHTCLEDVGWDIAAEIQKYKLSHKVLLTYIDQSTGNVYLDFYRGKIAHSKSNNTRSCVTPGTGGGVSREQLAKLHQIADLYVQYSVSEGDGMPQKDAKSCGVPVMALPYSAMAEQTLNGGALPLKILNYVQENVQETSQLRARPDNEYTAKAFYKYFTETQQYRDNLGEEARQCVLNNYTWDALAKKWEGIIDSIDVPSAEQTWFSPPKIFTPNLAAVPWQLPDLIFIRWCYNYVVGRPWLVNYGIENQILQQLTYGKKRIPVGMGYREEPYSKQNLINEMIELCNQANNFEYQRYHAVTGNGEIQRFVKI